VLRTVARQEGDPPAGHGADRDAVAGLTVRRVELDYSTSSRSLYNPDPPKTPMPTECDVFVTPLVSRKRRKVHAGAPVVLCMSESQKTITRIAAATERARLKNGVHIELSPRRVRAYFDNQLLVDSQKVLLVFETRRPPVY
jgi:hypothetical protein